MYLVIINGRRMLIKETEGQLMNPETIVLLEDRKYGRSGTFKLYYDIATGDYAEPPEGFLESEETSISRYLAIKQSF